MTDTVRIGFIGAGKIAARQMDALRCVPGVEIAAASGRDGEKLARLAAAYSIPRVETDWRGIVARDDIDAVSVCTPNNLHCGQTIAALEAGKHVLVEKPMALNAAEAARMRDAARTAGKILQVGFQQRFSADARMLKTQAEKGFFGRILFVRVQVLRRRGIPNWGSYVRKELQGGGPLIDVGIHNLEAAHYIMGSPEPESASGVCSRFLGGRTSTTVSRWPGWDSAAHDVEDFAAGFVRFRDGAALSIETSFAAHIDRDVSRIQIFGTEGGAAIEPSLRVFGRGDPVELGPAELYRDVNDYMMTMTPAYRHTDNCFDFKMTHFIDCVLGRTACLAPAEDGVLVQRIIDGIYRSAELGKEVSPV